MTTLRSRDLAALLEAVDEIGTMQTDDALRHRVPSLLYRLVPCDAAVYQEMSVSRGQTMWVTEPLDASAGSDPDDFVRNSHQHPVVSHFQETGDPRAYRISDFIGVREYHSTDLYDQFFGPLGVERLMTSLLPVAPGEFVASVVCRERASDFGERDRAMMNALVAHLHRAYDRAADRQRVDRLLAGLSCVGDGRYGVVLMGSGGDPDLVTDQARRWFGGERLPAGVADWLEECRRSAPTSATTVVDSQAGRLVVRFLGSDALLVERLDGALSANALRTHGLTRREVEVLEVLAEGKTYAEIADDLFISPGTVRRHLNSIYGKLGVHNRGTAVARARDISVSAA
jgi:DNA-binding CsgD family transcriptional regulator